MDARPAAHPSDAMLHAFGLSKLADSFTAEMIRQHLETCSDCRARMAAVSGKSDPRQETDAPIVTRDVSDIARAIKAAEQVSTGPSELLDLPRQLRDHPQYEILRELGRGGMGVVYLAMNKQLRQPEVLKVMNATLLGKEGAADRFLREMRLAAKLSRPQPHPNIVTIYKAFTLGQTLGFAMEFVVGADLAKVVKGRQKDGHGLLPVGKACAYAAQAAQGLQHAFAKGMVHRDIKPQNLMLLTDGNKESIKILDFGLAKARSEQEPGGGITGDQCLGTPEYMAPEQWRHTASSDIRADIYSLGCTLYFLLAGRAPFKGRSAPELWEAHRERAAQPLGDVRSDVPASLAAVVAKMMAKARSQRFQAPKEVVAALAPFLQNASSSVQHVKEHGADAEPISVVPTSRPALTPPQAAAPRRAPGVESRKPPKRSRTGLMIVSACILAALVAGGAMLWVAGPWLGSSNPKEQAPQAANPAPQAANPAPQAANSEIDPGYDLTGGFPFVSFQSGAPRVVLLGSNQRFARVYDLETGQPQTPPLEHSKAVTHAAFSPDGSRVVTTSEDATARVWDAKTGVPVSQPLQHGKTVRHASFSPDGKRVVTASNDFTARVWDAESGQAVSPPVKQENRISLALFSPDGKRVLTPDKLGGDFRIWDAATGQTITTLDNILLIAEHVSFAPDGKRVAAATFDRVTVWDAANGQELISQLAKDQLLMHDKPVVNFSYSPDGKRLVTASEDKTARVWDAVSGQPATPPLKHDDHVVQASFSRDGKRVVTASKDKTARVWSVATGEPIGATLKHDEPPLRAAFSPDGKHVVTTSGASAWLWDVDTGKELKKVKLAAN
jgi:WD40 repeat protein/serine/threonine protein kinase